jgi:hypothetical protein
MEINLGTERIVQLQAAFSLADIQDTAWRKRTDAFGQMTKLFQRPRADDISISSITLRFEPFWHARATARYAYDRRHVYRVPVASEVESATVYGSEHVVSASGARTFELPAVEHCVEVSTAEISLDAVSGAELAADRYLSHAQIDVPYLTALEVDGAQVVPPEQRSSYVVRKLVPMLMRTFQADRITEERIDVEEVILAFRPIYSVEYLWESRDRRQVLHFDGLTGDVRAAPSEAIRSIQRVLDNDALFDIGADTVGTIVPGANIAIKLGRLAARKVIQ